ncbi:hypothetical protein Q8A73_007475 [Channa argus]|nr:hypothetical protein Q8A73_007475 [Channa argus]
MRKGGRKRQRGRTDLKKRDVKEMGHKPRNQTPSAREKTPQRKGKLSSKNKEAEVGIAHVNEAGWPWRIESGGRVLESCEWEKKRGAARMPNRAVVIDNQTDHAASCIVQGANSSQLLRLLISKRWQRAMAGSRSAHRLVSVRHRGRAARK